MGTGEHGGRWVGPEDVPDPVALRRVRAESSPPLAEPTVDFVEDPPSEPSETSESSEFTLEPGPVNELAPPTVVVSAPPRPVPLSKAPAAVSRRPRLSLWIVGTVVLVAALAAGSVLLGGSAEPPPAPSATAVQIQPRRLPDLRGAIYAPATPPAPAVAAEAAPAPEAAPPATPPHARRRSRTPKPEPVVEAAPTHAPGEAPPPAVVRPRVAEPAQADGTETADAVNPWTTLEP